MFADRTDAGRQLAAELAERGIAADLGLAVPRGGLPLGRAVADWLGVPLDIVAAKKLGAPGNPELAVGAAASDGSRYLNDDLVARLGLNEAYVENQREKAAATAREKERTYRSGPPPDLRGKRIVIVDDGLATGATAIACIRKAEAEGASRVVLAIPVGSVDSNEAVAAEADQVVVLKTPSQFGAVGSHYRDFSQVCDEEAMAYLEH